MDRERREAIRAQGLEEVGCKALVGPKGAVQILAVSSLAQQLPDRARSEPVQVFDLALSFEVRHHHNRDIAARAGRLDTENIAGVDGVRSRVEIGRSRVGRGVRPGTLNAPCGARGWGVKISWLKSVVLVRRSRTPPSIARTGAFALRVG